MPKINHKWHVGILAFFATALGFAGLSAPASAEDLKVIFFGLGGGTVTSSPGGINAPGDCDETFATGATVTLTATASPGSSFVRWRGGASGSANMVTITMDADKAVQAVFELDTVIPTFRDFLKKTFEDGDVDIGSDVITIPGHGFAHGQKVRFESDSLPTGIQSETTHFVQLIGADSFGIVAWSTYPPMKMEVDITDASSGATHTVYPEGPTPEQLQDYLDTNPAVNSADRFLAALDPEYKFNWILMTRSESLQTGVAKYPRLLLPSSRADFVFTIGMLTHGSFPGSHPNAVEYMQWDPGENNFRFHEVVLDDIPDLPVGGPTDFPARTRGVLADDIKCSKCHSTRNVLNNSTDAGTTGFPIGSVKVKNKPNWDTYDSWGGMLPFNRDRIYQGTVEAAAFRQIFNLWNWRNSPQNDSIRRILEQLRLQADDVPDAHKITRLADGRIRFGFDPEDPPTMEPMPIGSAPDVLINYEFDRNVGTGAGTLVVRGGDFVTLQHSEFPGDEGRGVQLFDLLGGADGQFNGFPNQMRVADEIISHEYATGSIPIDVRPIALAVTRFARMGGDAKILEISGSNVVSAVPGAPLSIDLSFFNNRNGSNIEQMIVDTRTRAQVLSPQRDRAQSLTRRRADIQKLNFDRTDDIYLRPAAGGNQNGLIQEYGAFTLQGSTRSLPRLRQEVFRRPTVLSAGEGGVTSPDQSVMGGYYVDREQYFTNIEPMALYRFFLEPLGVSVDKWSMGVRGRSRAYNFADIFGTYTDVLNGELTESLTDEFRDPADPGRFLDPDIPEDLIKMVNITLGSLPDPNDVPRFTDVQRIFNKSCIECHGGLNYPPYSNTGSKFVDLSEQEDPPLATPEIDSRLARSHLLASALASRIRTLLSQTSEDCEIGGGVPNDLMPCQGPPLTKADIQTFGRWVDGGSPFSHGDPHLRTVDGTRYDFQADGEFVLLRGMGSEIQSRMASVNTAGPLGPNGHTGLTTCVSVNSAIAIRTLEDRVTYQPNLGGQPDPKGMQLRVNGALVSLDDLPMRLPSRGRIVRTDSEHGIQVHLRGGGSIIITPTWWPRQSMWYMNIDTLNMRATRGLMGAIAPDNWLPALPNGELLGPRPADLNERFQQLYDEFGNAWRVTDDTTLFDYAAGTSTATFTNKSWPRGESGDCAAPIPNRDFVKPLPPIPREEAEKLASKIVDPALRENCVADLMTTGDRIFLETYLQADQILRSRPAAPTLIFPMDNVAELSGPIDFQWAPLAGRGRDGVTYKLVVWPIDEMPDDNEAVSVALKDGEIKNSLTRTLGNFDPGKSYYWKIIAEDKHGSRGESVIRRFQLKQPLQAPIQ